MYQQQTVPRNAVGVRTLPRNNILPVQLPNTIPSNNTHSFVTYPRSNVINMPSQIIINPTNSILPLALKPKGKGKKEKKTTEEFHLLFCKWMLDLPSEGIDVSYYYFDTAKKGIFCTACQNKYSKGLFSLTFFWNDRFFFLLFFWNDRFFFLIFFGMIAFFFDYLFFY